MTARTNHSWNEWALGESRAYPIREGRTAVQEQKRLTKAFWHWQQRDSYPWRKLLKITTRRIAGSIEVRRTA